jgi:hypothetical protein
MNSEPHNDGAPNVSGFARVVTSLINSGAIACELALFAPPQPRRVEHAARPGSSSSPETPDMHTIGAGR